METFDWVGKLKWWMRVESHYLKCWMRVANCEVFWKVVLSCANPSEGGIGM